ncbi:MMPL family transporter [Nesterenkonia flava]|uniref:MMPL family transporter n=1 Tax=Nesterenkonia flava TaxID=469799 RepID=A0ABU1FWI9_9MICC|nr:MMPL family transporter [Nesterenkonia flava]MDR5712973.1 MMPL family transporter [Nesterenkonia flava]
MAKLLYRLGLLAARRAKTVIAAWFVALIVAVSAFLGFGGQLTDQITVPDLETTDVANRLADELPDAGGGSATAVVRTENGEPFTEDQQRQISELIDEVEQHEIVDSVTDPFATEEEMAQGREELEAGRAELENAPAELENARQELEAGRAELEAGLAQAGMSIEDLPAAREELEAGRAQFEQQLEESGMSAEELPSVREELEGGLAQLDAEDAQLDAQVQEALAGGYWPSVEAELNAARATIVAQRGELQAQLAQVQAAEAGLAEIEANDAAITEAEDGLAEIEAGEAEVREGEEALENGEAEAELERGERMLALTEDASMVSEDESAAILMVGFHDPLEQVGTEDLAEVAGLFTEAEIDGVDVLPGGDLSFEMPHLFSIAEIIGLMVAAVVLLVMLGTFIGAGLPLLNALVGVGIGVAGAMALSGVVEMMSMTPILGLMLGLAVGIDYALFIINRHRRQLKDGMPLLESIALANGTAGNAVVFAGATVIIALLALNVTGLPFLALMGTVAAFCVVVAVLMATTMTPALLKLVGWKILRRKERRRIGLESEKAEKISTPMSTAKALGIAVVSLVGLGLLAVPTFDLRLGLPDASSESEDSAAHQAYVEIEESFGQGMNGPLVVLADFPEAMEEGEASEYQLDVAEGLADHEHIDVVVPITLSEDNSMAAYQVIPVGGPASESTEALVHEFRDGNPLSGTDVADAELSVAGMTAAQIDISDVIADAMPLYLALVIGLSLILMIMVFRSILLPVVATLGFVGSLAGSIGVVVAVFQWGWLGEVFGISRPGPIMTFLPILMVGILFGLAMDYQLFTASGMREAYVHGSAPRLAVRQGLHAGRAVVTAAALIMASVFAGFVFTPDPMIASIGLGLAVGVLLDAFVVRLLLVPAVLTLCGPAAWWLPGWLDKILPDVDVEGSALERQQAETHQGAGI